MSQLKEGIKVEMEHKGTAKWVDRFEHQHGKLPSDKMVAEHIAKAHLKEDSHYYDKLRRARL